MIHIGTNYVKNQLLRLNLQCNLIVSVRHNSFKTYHETNYDIQYEQTPNN